MSAVAGACGSDGDPKTEDQVVSEDMAQFLPDSFEALGPAKVMEYCRLIDQSPELSYAAYAKDVERGIMSVVLLDDYEEFAIDYCSR